MNSRDKLLIRASMWAAVMNETDNIDLVGMFDHDHMIAEFIVNAVADYIMSGSSENFDEYIRGVLTDEFGVINYEDGSTQDIIPCNIWHKCSEKLPTADAEYIEYEVKYRMLHGFRYGTLRYKPALNKWVFPTDREDIDCSSIVISWHDRAELWDDSTPRPKCATCYRNKTGTRFMGFDCDGFNEWKPKESDV